MENSQIEWTDNTFNPWIGCTKVSPGCKFCYAEALMDERYKMVNWGKGNPRKRTSVKNWKQIKKWDKEAKIRNIMIKVFCASLADVFDDEVNEEWRKDLFDLMSETTNIHWLLLTKREKEAVKHIKSLAISHADTLNKIWLGITVEDQKRASERIGTILEVRSLVPILFLSCEPLLENVEIPHLDKIDWVIVGGESGKNARKIEKNWILAIKEQCEKSNTAFFFKQWGGKISKEKKKNELDGKKYLQFPIY